MLWNISWEETPKCYGVYLGRRHPNDMECTCAIVVYDLHVVKAEPTGVLRARENGGVEAAQFGLVVEVLLQ